MGNAAKILCSSPDVENQKILNPILFYCKLSKITLAFIQWINQSELLFWYLFQNLSKNHQGTLELLLKSMVVYS